MKKLLILVLAMLLLTGCGADQPQAAAPSTDAATTEATTPETTETTAPEAAEQPGTYIIREQVYYDANERQQAKLTVSFNEQGLPETVLMDSGADITYTPEYGEKGVITGFTMTKTLYGEETVNQAQINEQGDIVKKITKGTTVDLRYEYNADGRFTKREQLSGEKLLSSEVWEYDAQGHKTFYSCNNLVKPEQNAALHYENTYDNDRLVKVVCTTEDGQTNFSRIMEYDEQGLLLKEEETAGNQITTTVYVYNDAGLIASETTQLNGTETERVEYTYDENGCVAEKRNYEDGEFKNRAIFSYEKIQLTPAQIKVYKQFSIIP